MNQNVNTQQGISPTPLKEVPVGVKVLAVLQYIGAVVSFLFGLFFIFGATTMISVMTSMMSVPGEMVKGVFVFLGVLFVGIAVLYFFMAKGLWKGKNWARITSIVFCCLGVLSALLSLIIGNFVALLSLAINGFFAGYLLFNKEVKTAFE